MDALWERWTTTQHIMTTLPHSLVRIGTPQIRHKTDQVVSNHNKLLTYRNGVLVLTESFAGTTKISLSQIRIICDPRYLHTKLH